LCLGNIAILAALQWFLSGKWIEIFDVYHKVKISLLKKKKKKHFSMY